MKGYVRLAIVAACSGICVGLLTLSFRDGGATTVGIIAVGLAIMALDDF
jgi:hypothetical protein